MGFDERTRIATCDHCGAEYLLKEFNMGIRDKDSLPCQDCGKTLHTWNSTSYYSYDKKLKEGDPPKKSE